MARFGLIICLLLAFAALSASLHLRYARQQLPELPPPPNAGWDWQILNVGRPLDSYIDLIPGEGVSGSNGLDAFVWETNRNPNRDVDQKPNTYNQGKRGSSNQRNPNRRTERATTTPSSEISTTTLTYHIVPEGCDCPSTRQFNPVCGSDGNTYRNAGLLKCFRFCGSEVTQRRLGKC